MTIIITPVAGIFNVVVNVVVDCPIVNATQVVYPLVHAGHVYAKILLQVYEVTIFLN